MNKKFSILSISLLLLILVGCSPQVEESSEVDSPPEDSDISQELPINPTDGQNPAAGAMLAGSNAIFINMQQPGTEVFVNTLLLQEPGYVVIHRNEGGEPGEVVGHSELLGTDVIDASFTLDQPMEEGEEFFAMLHTDDGDGEYQFPGPDAPLTDEQTGDPIMMAFTASESATDEPQVLP